MFRHSLLLIALGSLLTATAAHATPVTLNFSSDFTYFATLNDVALSDHTPFSFQARFDSASDLDPAPGIGVFNAQITFHLLGNTYIVDPASDVEVLLLDPVSGFGYGAGLTHSSFGFNLGANSFSSVTSPFSADAPTSSSLLTGANNGFSASSFTIYFIDGQYLTLINENAFYSSDSTAEISSVPEPATLSLCVLAAGIGALRLGRRAA